MVRLVGWRSLGISAQQEASVQELIQRHLHRMQGLVRDLADMSIHVKQASKHGERHRYDIHLVVIGDGKLFHADRTDWDLRTALHKSFVSVENQVKRWTPRNYIDAMNRSAEPLLGI
jgi:ribosome-associated translation inhibitor RaiA